MVIEKTHGIKLKKGDTEIEIYGSEEFVLNHIEEMIELTSNLDSTNYQKNHVKGEEVKESANAETEDMEQIKEIPGIAFLDEKGIFHITIRDLKAKTAKEAAKKLIYVTLRAYEKLTSNNKISSRKILVPILKEWRLYDGNTRRIISEDKGITREKDLLWLDTPAKKEADIFIKEILDESIKESWVPGSTKKRKKEKTNV